MFGFRTSISKLILLDHSNRLQFSLNPFRFASFDSILLDSILFGFAGSITTETHTQTYTNMHTHWSKCNFSIIIAASYASTSSIDVIAVNIVIIFLSQQSANFNNNRSIVRKTWYEHTTPLVRSTSIALLVCSFFHNIWWLRFILSLCHLESCNNKREMSHMYPKHLFSHLKHLKSWWNRFWLALLWPLLAFHICYIHCYTDQIHGYTNKYMYYTAYITRRVFFLLRKCTKINVFPRFKAVTLYIHINTYMHTTMNNRKRTHWSTPVKNAPSECVPCVFCRFHSSSVIMRLFIIDLGATAVTKFNRNLK